VTGCMHGCLSSRGVSGLHVQCVQFPMTVCARPAQHVGGPAGWALATPRQRTRQHSRTLPA